MKHGKSGVSIAEVCLAMLVVGLLYSALASSVSGVSSHHGRLLQRVAAMSWITSFTSNLSQPEVLKEIVLKERDSSELNTCLTAGCSVDTQGSFAISEDESIPSALKARGSFRVITPNLVELRMNIESTDVFLNARTIRILVSRRSFMPHNSNIAESSCSMSIGYRRQHIVGLDAKGGNFICRDHYINEEVSSQNPPFRLPASGLGREWDQ